MRCVQVLSALALQRLLQHCAETVAIGGGPMEELLPPCAHQAVALALHQANARTWVVIQVLAVGKDVLDQVARAGTPDTERTLLQPVRSLLKAFAGLSSHRNPDCRQALRQALDSGV